MVSISRAELDDLDGITEIYNDAILNTTATFDTKPKTMDQQGEWFAEHGPRYPIIVARSDAVVAGWASLTKWSDRCAYADTAEISLYVKEGFQGKGLGKKLLETILEHGRKEGLHTIVARIANGNEVSVHLHESVGFEHIGVMKEVGRKFGKLIDIYLMQKLFQDLDNPQIP